MRRVCKKKISYDLTYFERECPITHRFSLPLPVNNTLPQPKYTDSPFDQSPNDPLAEHNTSSHLTAKQIFQSRRQTLQRVKLNWKILTLQQLKGNKPSSNPRSQSKQKLYVSLSKKNRQSSQKVVVQPKLQQVGRDLHLLRSLSNKRKIVDKIQIQLQEESRPSRLICG